MKIKYLFCLVFILLFFSFCSSANEPFNSAEEKEKIQQTAQRFLSALNSSDLDALLEEVAEDAIWMIPDYPIFSGKEEVKVLYETAFKSNTYNYSHAETITDIFHKQLDGTEINVFNDLYAMARISEIGTITEIATGKVTEINHKAINVYKKGADGNWRIWRAIVNDGR